VVWKKSRSSLETDIDRREGDAVTAGGPDIYQNAPFLLRALLGTGLHLLSLLSIPFNFSIDKIGVK